MNPKRAWLTPSASLPLGTRCYTIAVPNDEGFRRILLGALGLLIDPENYQQFGTLTPLETSEQFRQTTTSFLFQEGECSMIGAIIPYVGNAIPPKMLPCDGSTFQRVDYPLLYQSLLGSTLVLNADQFITPLLEGRVLRGETLADPFNTIGGSDNAIIGIEHMPEHHHDYYGVVMNIDVESVGVPDPVGAGINPIPDPTSSVGGGQPLDIRPAFYAVKYGIVAK